MSHSSFPKLAPLINYLNTLQNRVDLERLAEYLASLDISVNDIAEACVFGDTNYKRNKISGSNWYDLLVICWRAGQTSAIHDHAGSSCGFRIITGVATEVRYKPVGHTAEELAKGLVQPISTSTYCTGQLCLAQDTEIHRIANASTSENLITIHIYSPPLQMNYYDLAPGITDAPGCTGKANGLETEAQRSLAGEKLPGERVLFE